MVLLFSIIFDLISYLPQKAISFILPHFEIMSLRYVTKLWDSHL